MGVIYKLWTVWGEIKHTCRHFSIWHCVLYCDILQLSALCYPLPLRRLLYSTGVRYYFFPHQLFVPGKGCHLVGHLPAAFLPWGGELDYSALHAPSPPLRSKLFFQGAFSRAATSHRQHHVEGPVLLWRSSTATHMASQRVFSLLSPCLTPACPAHSWTCSFWFMGFFLAFFPLWCLSLAWWLSVRNTPFSASWASFVRSKTKALHRCPYCAGAYTVGSCHAKYKRVIKFPWGSFPFQSSFPLLLKSSGQQCLSSSIFPQLLHDFNFMLNQNTLLGLGWNVR